MRTVYVDYNATTPVDSRVRAAMEPFFSEVWGNPSSVHHVGRRARALLDEARDRAATLLVCKPSEVIFTSGGTESNNLAILGTARALKNKGRHLVTSSVEHHAVLHSFEYLARNEGFEVSYLPVNGEGRVSVASLEQALRPDTILVSIMAANNEVGTIQPVAELGALCREKGVLFHTDAVQWFGKGPFADIGQFNADLVSICGHKFYGPKGAGILYSKSPLKPEAVLLGGSHENERRAGTENLPAITGLVAAMELFVREPVFAKEKLIPLVAALLETIDSTAGIEFAGSREHRLANTLSFVVPGADSLALLAGLDLKGICASSGSACSAGSLEPSHVILAMNGDAKRANSLVRFSLGRENTSEEVDYIREVLPKVIRRAQRSE